MTHKFQVGETVQHRESGKLYQVRRLRFDDHPKLKGEIGYDVIGLRDGQFYGPIRLIRESVLKVVSS